MEYAGVEAANLQIHQFVFKKDETKGELGRTVCGTSSASWATIPAHTPATTRGV